MNGHLRNDCLEIYIPSGFLKTAFVKIKDGIQYKCQSCYSGVQYILLCMMIDDIAKKVRIPSNVIVKKRELEERNYDKEADETYCELPPPPPP